eukprot:1207183-Karenia_brevis.AAC.1
MRMQKLALFGRVAVRATTAVLSAIVAARDAVNSWLKSVSKDLKWLAQSHEYFECLENLDLVDWVH